MFPYTQNLVISAYIGYYKLTASSLLIAYIILLFIITYGAYESSGNINSLWIIPILYIIISEAGVYLLDKLIGKYI